MLTVLRSLAFFRGGVRDLRLYGGIFLGPNPSWFIRPGRCPSNMYLEVHGSTCIVFGMTDKKMWKEMRRQLQAAGCEIVQPKGRSHVRVYHDGVLVTVMQQSQSCYRAYQNKRAELRRKGFEVT